ncbi:MAG TPA: hypothetical protein VLG37_01445 [Candidatus Saccharimonadales bacterium]|nr:hypothetical protein [Candidatus Saccharimonadales bacterium]
MTREAPKAGPNELVDAAYLVAEAMIDGRDERASVPIDLGDDPAATLANLYRSKFRGQNKRELSREDGGKDVVWVFDVPIVLGDHDFKPSLYVVESYPSSSSEGGADSGIRASFELRAPAAYLQLIMNEGNTTIPKPSPASLGWWGKLTHRGRRA